MPKLHMSISTGFLCQSHQRHYHQQRHTTRLTTSKTLSMTSKVLLALLTFAVAILAWYRYEAHLKIVKMTSIISNYQTITEAHHTGGDLDIFVADLATLEQKLALENHPALADQIAGGGHELSTWAARIRESANAAGMSLLAVGNDGVTRRLLRELRGEVGGATRARGEIGDGLERVLQRCSEVLSDEELEMLGFERMFVDV